MKKIINLLAVLLISITASFAQTSTPTTQHLKKDGTVDKRYKANKQLLLHLLQQHRHQLQTL